MLIKGKHVRIFAGETFITGDFPLALFNATSTKVDLLVGGRVQVPADVDIQGILTLLNYFKDMVHWRKGSLRLSNDMGVHDMLAVTSAAEALGMEKYVDHIFRKCEALLRKDLPTYEDLDAITSFAKQHPRLLNVVAFNNLAVRMREGAIPDVEDFAAYLAGNPTLNTAIEAAGAKYEEYIKFQQQNEEAHEIRVKNAIANAAVAERAALRAKEQKVKSNAFWAKKKAEDAEDEKAIQKKLKLTAGKRQFTPREAQHWRKTRGTKLPVGC
jgi:hypothetical protein